MSHKKIHPHNLLFLPPKHNFQTPKLLNLVVEARSQLGELKGYSVSLPNPLLLLSPAIIKESLASSEVENIHTTIIKVLENQIFAEEERKNPDKEVLRYHESIIWGFNNLNQFNLSSRLILGIQDRLLPKREKGYRRQQNAIEDKKAGKIVYTPPLQTKIPEYMSNLEIFFNKKTKGIDPLISCAIGHYQFEAIHPFEDGNGRAGRILMVLHLIKHGIISLPILYISGYISQNKNEYYKRLFEVTTKGKWNEYIEFMLKGFSSQAKVTKDLLFKIMIVYKSVKTEVKKLNKKVYSSDLIKTLFTYPFISPVKLGKELGCHYTTASRYLENLEKMGILVSKKIGRHHLYANVKLIKALS